MMTLLELLSDPVRARIYLEVLLNEEVTAQQLMDKTKVNRSTMSHHLSKFVDGKVLKFRVQEQGRAVKIYSRNPEFREEVILEDRDDTSIKKRIVFLESTAVHLNAISSLLGDKARRLREGQSSSKRGSTVSFTFNFLTKEEADIWYKEYEEFQKRFEERRKSIKESSDSFDYIGYGGITPTK
jgi:DNA-binding transcriptional ArsR family regulator